MRTMCSWLLKGRKTCCVLNCSCCQTCGRDRPVPLLALSEGIQATVVILPSSPQPN